MSRIHKGRFPKLKTYFAQNYALRAYRCCTSSSTITDMSACPGRSVRSDFRSVRYKVRNVQYKSRNVRYTLSSGTGWNRGVTGWNRSGTNWNQSVTEEVPGGTEWNRSVTNWNRSVTEVEPSVTEVAPTGTKVWPKRNRVEPSGTELNRGNRVEPSGTVVEPTETEVKGPNLTAVTHMSIILIGMSLENNRIIPAAIPAAFDDVIWHLNGWEHQKARAYTFSLGTNIKLCNESFTYLPSLTT